MLHLTIQTCPGPQATGNGVTETCEGTLHQVIERVVNAIIRAKSTGVMEANGSVNFTVQAVRVKVTGA